MRLFSVYFLVVFCVISSPLEAKGPWIMEWWGLEPVQINRLHSVKEDWIQTSFGIPEAQLTRYGRVPPPTSTGQHIIEAENGTTEFRNGRYTTKTTESGGGVFLNLRGDAFRFTYLELHGEFEIAMRVESLRKKRENFRPFLGAQIGLMVRQDNSPGSPHLSLLFDTEFTNQPDVALGIFKANGPLTQPYSLSFYARERAACSLNRRITCVTDDEFPNMTFPVWLKLERGGNNFTGSWSKDGKEWTKLTTVTHPILGNPVLVGFAVGSGHGSPARQATGVVSDFSVNGEDPELENMISEDIGILKGTYNLHWSVYKLGETTSYQNLMEGFGTDRRRELTCSMSTRIYYRMLAVTSPTAQDTLLHIAHFQYAKVWLNGKLVGEFQNGTASPMTTRPINVHLVEGINLVLVKVNYDYMNARFETENLTFSPKDGVFDLPPDAFAPRKRQKPSPDGKLTTTWGEVKTAR